MSQRILLRGGRVVDPSRKIDELLDLALEDGFVAESGVKLAARGALVLEVKGLVVCPGFIDLETHLREPGQEDKETIASGTRAAAAGGFTAVCAMPDTDPINDQAGITRAILERARAEGVVRVHPVGAITRDLAGRELAEHADLKDAGCVALSDAGRALLDARVLRRALEYAGAFGLTLVAHCEERSLCEKAVMNEGPVSTWLGLRGAPSAAETMGVERDVLLAELTRGRLHIARVSAAASLDAIRRAKARGLRVTADVTPHHLLLTDERVRESQYDTATKVNPPLRSEGDRQALLAGLRDGAIDAIATDHSPHTVDDKKVEFDQAAFGISGLETAVALCLDRLVGARIIDLARLVELFSTGPARIFGLPGGTLAPGSPADVTVLDPQAKRTVDPRRFLSKGRSTPFAGVSLKGWPALTIVGGRVAWSDLKA
ncbi:MAG TPA: dihydroorotase [Vicinamibacteria bacterium]